MRFIHCSDLHLDSKIERLPTEKTRIRREEIVRTFERLIEYASKNGVTAVIIAGDMFDTARVSNKTRARVVGAIKNNPNVDFLYLSGNHDDDNFISEIEQLPENLKVFTDSWSFYEYGNVVVGGIRLSNANSSSAPDALNLQADKFNIITMHGQVAGYKSKENAEVISIPRLKDKNVDYLALGHIHSYSEGKIDNRGIYVYSGCLDGRGFDETGAKGFVLIDVDQNNKCTHEFINFSSRCLYEYEFSVDGIKDWLDARDELVKDLMSKYSETSLIKVVLKGAHKPEFEIDKEGLASRLNEEFFYAKVYDRTELEIDVLDFENDKSVRGEFVRAVWESSLSKEEKSRVIMCGINALKGEDL